MKRIMIIVVGLVVLLSAGSAFADWEGSEHPYFAGLSSGQVCGGIIGFEASVKHGHLGLSAGMGLPYPGDPYSYRMAYLGYAVTGKFYFEKDYYNGAWIGVGYGTLPIVQDENNKESFFGLVGFSFEFDFITVQPAVGVWSKDFTPTMSLSIGGVF